MTGHQVLETRCSCLTLCVPSYHIYALSGPIDLYRKAQICPRMIVRLRCFRLMAICKWECSRPFPHLMGMHVPYRNVYTNNIIAINIPCTLIWIP